MLMKKLLAMLLVLSMCLELGACTLFDKYSKEKTTQETRQINDNVVEADDPIYAQIDDMLPCIYKFVEYIHILGSNIDYDDIGAEDFWNIVALVAGSYPKIGDICDVDVAGVYHINWYNAADLAKTFMYRTVATHDYPNYQASYSATADPGSGIIDLVPLNVDNYDASVERIVKDTNDPNVDYVIYIKLSGRDDDLKCHHYAVYITEWDRYAEDVFDNVDDRKGEHYMPYMVVGYSYAGSDERVIESTDESKN